MRETHRYFAGIGSRSTPDDIQQLMTKVSAKLTGLGWILRSGGARGADRAFERGAVRKEVFKATDAKPWAFTEAKLHMPTDREGFDSWSPYVQGLMARNMMQILGPDGDKPVQFVICWAPSTVYTDSSAGGTGWAIRCAIAHGIRVHNWFVPSALQMAMEFMK